jgi:hypothetical protein
VNKTESTNTTANVTKKEISKNETKPTAVKANDTESSSIAQSVKESDDEIMDTNSADFTLV